MARDKLHVVVDGISIIVTMPGTDFAVTYQERFANPHLGCREHRLACDLGVPRPAFQAAVAKARE